MSTNLEFLTCGRAGDAWGDGVTIPCGQGDSNGEFQKAYPFFVVYQLLTSFVCHSISLQMSGHHLHHDGRWMLGAVLGANQCCCGFLAGEDGTRWLWRIVSDPDSRAKSCAFAHKAQMLLPEFCVANSTLPVC